jgi:cell division topological specificity factor
MKTMDWLKFFRAEPKNTASLAKERLKVVVAHQREGRDNGPPYLPRLREEILSVVRRYVMVADSAVHVNVQREDGLEVLEMNITLPDAPAA